MNKGAAFDFKAGEVVFREGDPWDGLYLIKSGTAEVFRERNGKNIRLSLLGPREFIGTVTIFTREPRTAGVRALTDLSLQHFDQEFVHQNFGFNDPAVNGLLKDVVSRLKDINRQFTDSVLSLSDDLHPWHEVVRHTRQLAYFLIILTRSSGFEWEGKTCVPVEGLPATQRNLFCFSESYGEALFQLLVRSGMLTLGEVPSRGLCLISPPIPKLQAFLDFTKQIISLELLNVGARETDLLPALRLLDGLTGNPEYGSAFPRKKLLPLLEKLFPNEPPIDVAQSLAVMGILSLPSDGEVRLDHAKILHHLHFNAILLGSQAMHPEGTTAF